LEIEMKNVVFAVLILFALALAACNMQVQAVPSTLPPTVATETSVYTQPLPTVGNFLTQMAPTIEATLTPFQPATATLPPIGNLIVTSRWEGEKVIVQTEFQWTDKSRTPLLRFELVCDGTVSSSGPINEGLNQAVCQPSIDFAFKIGGVHVNGGKKEGLTIDPVYQIQIP
jgi:hypothetical protein